MKRAALLLLFALFLAGSAALSAAENPPLDQVRLKDGRVLSGQIVEEHKGSIVMLVHGTRRTYDRSFIQSVQYSGPDAANPAQGVGEFSAEGSPQDGASVPSQPEDGLAPALAQRYRVPLRDVLWVRAQGVSDSELPLVFLIAATAQVRTSQVMALYQKGWTWEQIEDYYQMQPDDVTYEPGPWVDYPYYDPNLYVDLGWGWNGYAYGYGWNGYWGGRAWNRGRGSWGGRGAWGGRGHWGGAGHWSGGHGSWSASGGRVRVGAGSAHGGSWSGGGRASGGFSGGGRVSAGGEGGGGSRHR